MGKRLTTEEFVLRAKKVHGDRYDYSETLYVNEKTKVQVFCKKHGLFFQNPGHHVRRKQGCPQCKGHSISITDIKNASSNFILNAIRIHGYKYDYSTAK